MEPFLKWAGGKRWLADRVIRAFPGFRTYYEPFVGSGSVFFALEPDQAVLADTNWDLINCYRKVRGNRRAIVRKLRRLQLDKRTYYRVRCSFWEESDPVARAALFIYLNKRSWNGLYRVNRDGKFNVPMRDARRGQVFDEDCLSKAGRLLHKAKLLCCDFEQAVAFAGKGDLVYFDPPYITTHLNNGFVKYNAKLFSATDELRLAVTAKRLVQKGAAVVISNASHPFIRELYDGPFFKLEVHRASLIAADPANRRPFRELLISSFPLSV